jgi:hypothetical protein
MIIMDRENLFARGWSHVVSTGNDIDELETFRVLVGAPPQALQLDNRRWPHLDLRGEPRLAALRAPGIIVVERTADLIRYVRAHRGLTSRA